MTSPRLDPLVQLSIAMSVSPGGYAVLLGSGVSLEAGIPSGAQILSATKERLFRTHNDADPASPEELESWLESEGFASLGYSELLEEIFPAPQGRRDFLAAFFRGNGPGSTHLALAGLVAQGLLRVFVTTNFDPLLEEALQSKGISPVMVSDAETIESAPARETVECFVVKAHGDAGQLTVRNTLAEIETLQPRMQEELEEICSRHGILTLGYAGNDPAVATALKRTSPRFGLYWGTRRSDLPDGAKAIVSAVQAKTIVRPGARELVDELSRRVKAWAESPTGETPGSVRAEVIELLRAGDRVGVGELARAERRHFEDELMKLIEAAHEEFGPDEPYPAELKALETSLAALLERKLASGFALIEYGGDFQAEADWLASVSSRQLRLRDSSITSWIDAPKRLIWMLVWAYGAFAVSMRRFSAIKVLWETQEPTVEATPLAAIRQGGGFSFGVWLEFARFGKQVLGEGAWHLATILAASELVRDHYPELLRGEDGDGILGVLGSIGDASYFYAALGGRDEVEMPSYWNAPQVNLYLPLLMERDQRLQYQLIALFEPEPGTEEEIAAQILAWRQLNPLKPT